MIKQGRIEELCERYPELTVCAHSIEQAFQMMLQSFTASKKMLICGNGGSAADADHWSGELLKGFCSQRKLNAEWREKLGADIADNLQNALPCIPLTQFSALSTAFANDVNPQFNFAQLCWGLANAGDVFVGISTSGNARNVCLAAEVAKAKGVHVVALTGAGGGELAKLADCAIQVPENETYKVQELHLPVYHILCLLLEDHFYEKLG